MVFKKVKTVLSLFLICLLTLCACHSKVQGHRVVGVWEHDGSFIEFNKDGYFINGDKKYHFTATEDKITIDKNGEALVVEYTMNSNGTLTMNGLVFYPVRK